MSERSSKNPGAGLASQLVATLHKAGADPRDIDQLVNLLQRILRKLDKSR